MEQQGDVFAVRHSRGEEDLLDVGNNIGGGGGGGGGDMLDDGGGGGRKQVPGRGGRSGGRMNECGFEGNVSLWRGTGDGNPDGVSVVVLYREYLSGAVLDPLCGVSSKIVNRNKGLGQRRRKGATRSS
jgi:hypothetical protein